MQRHVGGRKLRWMVLAAAALAMAFGGKGFFVEDPKDIRGALDKAMAHDGPALVNVVLSQGSTRKAQQFAWHS